MVDGFLGGLLGYAFGMRIFRGVRHRELKRKAKDGVFLCGARVVSGRHPRLTSEWLPGEWHITPGRLVLGRIIVAVQSVESDSFRKASLREKLEASETAIVSIRTESALLEWSMLSGFEREALAALAIEPRRE